MVIKKYEELFEKLGTVEPSFYLLEKIKIRIKREKEFQEKKKALIRFFFLLVISFSFAPLSLKFLIEEVKNSGLYYFIYLALSDLNLFIHFWQNFILAILESLPVFAISFFILNIIILFSAIYFFLNKKRQLFNL